MNTARDLSSQLAEMLRREHGAMSDFLVALADFDRQRRWVELGYRSLFEYLHRELGVTKGAAHYRKVAAELIQRVPAIVEPLRDGRLCFTSIVELAKVLTPENQDEVLPRFFHRSKREAMVEVAALRPAEAPPTRAVVTALRLPAESAEAGPSLLPNAAPTPAPSELVPPAVQPVELARANLSPQSQQTRDTSLPLTADLSRLHVTVSRRFLAKLEAARAALSHVHPRASPEQVLEAGLDLVLAQRAKRKGLVAKPRATPRPANPDHVPAHVLREVWSRDDGKCQHSLASGGVCGSKERVEVHHVVARALGGPTTVENLSLRCRFHNDLEARREFGDGWMDRFTHRGPRDPRNEQPPTLAGPRGAQRNAVVCGRGAGDGPVAAPTDTALVTGGTGSLSLALSGPLKPASTSATIGTNQYVPCFPSVGVSPARYRERFRRERH
jgi:hypothetical protein